MAKSSGGSSPHFGDITKLTPKKLNLKKERKNTELEAGQVIGKRLAVSANRELFGVCPGSNYLLFYGVTYKRQVTSSDGWEH